MIKITVDLLLATIVQHLATTRTVTLSDGTEQTTPSLTLTRDEQGTSTLRIPIDCIDHTVAQDLVLDVGEYRTNKTQPSPDALVVKISPHTKSQQIIV